MAVWYVIGELGSLAEHTAPAELNANIRLEPGKHELTAEEIAAAKAHAAGDDPKVIEDPATGITILDYSDIL